MGKVSLVTATIVKLLLVLVIASSECWQVFLSGDRCLYPSSFHLFSSYVCVGQDAAAENSRRSHGPLCLPYLSTEMYRLPPTDDRTLARFSVLDAAIKLQGALPLLVLTLQWGSGGGGIPDGAPWVAALHLTGAFLAVLAVAAVLTAPAASAAAWADGVATCAVECQPGAALVLSAAMVPLELALAWRSLRAPPLLGSVLGSKGIRAADNSRIPH
jgi:hypothetical protein